MAFIVAVIGEEQIRPSRLKGRKMHPRGAGVLLYYSFARYDIDVTTVFRFLSGTHQSDLVRTPLYQTAFLNVFSGSNQQMRYQ